MDNYVKYTMPTKNDDAIIKDYSRIEIDIAKYLVGSVGVGFSKDGGLSLTLNDTRELENLITAITNAKNRLKEMDATSTEWGESIQINLFKGTHESSYSYIKLEK
jgi:hypothetical protein